MGTGARILSFMAAVATLAAGRSARADDELAHCVTHTERAPDEILVRLGDSLDSPVGISIVAGETLCLAGTVTHGVLAPKLADDGETALVRLRLDATDAATTLTVRSASDRELDYDAAIVTGPANLALPISGLHLQPRADGIQTFGPSVRRLLLRNLLFVDPPPPPVHIPTEDRLLQVSLTGLVGTRQLSAAAFDQPLRASGYGPLPRNYVGGGLTLGLSLARWRFEGYFLYAPSGAPSLVDSSTAGAAAADVRIDFGYDVLRWRGLTAFVLGGIGDAALMMDTRDAHWTYVADRTHVGSDVNTVEQDSIVLGAQVGLEQILPLGDGYGLVFSLRGGYEQQVADTGWSKTNESGGVSGLPALDLSGGWVSLGVGFTAFGPMWKQPPPPK
jgi:hypothetical protein